MKIPHSFKFRTPSFIKFSCLQPHNLPVADVDVFRGKGNLFGGMTETGAPKGLIVAVCKGIIVGIVVGWWWKKEEACWITFWGWAGAIWIMIGWQFEVVPVTTTEVAVVELLFLITASSISIFELFWTTVVCSW